MKPHCLAMQFALCVVALTAANAVVQHLASDSMPRLLLRRSEQGQFATDVFLGNSTMAAGLEEAAFAAAFPGRAPLNLGLGSTTPVEHYLVYLKQNRRPAFTLYYGFFDQQLTETPSGGWSTLVGNRAMAYYVDLNTALGFYTANCPTRAVLLRIVSYVPMLVERYSIWARIERIRRVLGDLGLPRKVVNQFGRAEDFGLLEAEDDAAFAKSCGHAAKARIPLSPPVEAMLKRSTARGAETYVIEMPVTEAHRRRFYNSAEWVAYRAHLVELVKEVGGHYVSGADWISDDGFSDWLHLNAEGARTFSTKLAQWVRQRE